MEDDFDEFFREFERMRRKIMKEFFKDIEFPDVEKLEKDGWVIQRIDSPNTHGFVARKIVVDDQWGKSPKLKEVKDDNVLFDIFENDDEFNIYIDLSGEKEEDILVSTDEDWVEVETPRRRKRIFLKSKIDPQSLQKKYKNGVLILKVKKKKA
ncbi:MAG: hypothetical protein B6U94_02195 [Thermofilum sp. ex4484_79]|nr:MAG: hypothetical protein B6U94_02195 [Thermofilum sp. ex4484_79]